MAIPRTTGERPRPRATVPAGEVQTGQVGKAIAVAVPPGAKARLVAGEDVENPAAAVNPQRLGR